MARVRAVPRRCARPDADDGQPLGELEPVDVGRRRRRRPRDRRDPARCLCAARSRPVGAVVTGPVPSVPTRAELGEHLVRARIAGDVGTSRASNVGNVHKMLARDPDYWFGVELDRAWTFEEAVATVAKRVGIDPDHTRESGADTIDVDLCLDALDDVADRLLELAERRGRVMFATGHPTGLLGLYLPLVAALSAAGCTVVTPAAERWVSVQGVQRRVRYVAGVATIGTGGDLLHTHSPEPMQHVLRESPSVDVVVADHGWAGAAGQAGLRTVGFADTNDPALFLA